MSARHAEAAPAAEAPKPALITYNYYDQSGARQLQANQDMKSGPAARVQRQLSPTFKQSLDEIVRSQRAAQAAPARPSGAQRAQAAPEEPVAFALRYQLSSYEQRCVRCAKTVYQMDKVGPLKAFSFFHQACFKCRQCGTKLTLKTYFNNQQASGDAEVYCHRHCPKTGPGRLDGHAVGIRAALNAPRLSRHEAGQAPAAAPAPASGVDGRALHIQHAVQQTRLQHIYKHAQADRKLAALISSRLEFLEPKQKLLEARHREEEDALFRAFALKWRREERSVSDQVRREWQLELAKLLERAQRPAPRAPQPPVELERAKLEKSMTLRLDKRKETLKRKLRHFERQATAELVEKQSREMLQLISLKLDEFRREQKRQIGCELEQFQAVELLANQLGCSLQLSPAAGQARPQPQVRPEAAPPPAPAPRAPQVAKLELYEGGEPDEVFRELDLRAINVARAVQHTFTELVHHLTRDCATDVHKARAIFRWLTVKNLNTMHFDTTVKPDTPLGLLRGIQSGSESYHVLFKRLCSYAGLHCVVIKGYSKSAGYQPGLRFEGSRFKNSWNAVFVAGAWRFVQCNWGARHLVSVAVMQEDRNQSGDTGAASKTAPAAAANFRPAALGSAASSPTSRSPPSSASSSTSSSSSSSSSSSYGSASSSPASGSPPLAPGSPARTPPAKAAAGNDSLRYEYDDHYFLTDPDEFIYEFFPLEPEWQLTKTRPISLSEFERLPFVRSLFFKYGLYFPQRDIRSVLHADSSGATTIKIGMPTHMIPSLIFHYNLKRYDTDDEHHDGVSLKRFVMQSVESGDNQHLVSNIVSFRVHLPENGAYILDIFANSTTPTEYITGEPMKFKSVCKFKIVAKQLKTVMIPLPNCASGEFGPMKATRLFGIVPITHESGLICVQNERRHLEIQFRMTRPLLDFMAALHKNGYDERQLSKAIKILIDGDIVYVAVKFFDDGQYGLDLYTRESLESDPQASCSTTSDAATQETKQPKQATKQRHMLTHCCKYLINVKAPKTVADLPGSDI